MNIGIKNTKQGVFTPVVYLKRGTRKVVLVGMLHIAETAHYSTIQRLLDRLSSEGYKVLYEVFDAYRDLGSNRVVAQLIRRYHTRTEQIIHQYLGEYNVAYQTQVFRLRPDWIPADVDDKYFGMALPSQKAEIWRNVLKEINKDPKKLAQMYWSALKSLSREMTNAEKKKLEGDLSSMHSVVIKKRDAFAARMVLRHSKYHPVATCWGVAHIQGIQDHLQQAGFKISTKKWIRICRRLKGEL